MKEVLRKTLCIAMLIVGFLYAFFSISNIIIAEVNYKHNNTLTIDSRALNSEGCIINQSGVTGYRYGINSFVEKGCGLVTVYNVLNYFDQAKPLQDIIRSFDRHGNNLWGVLGTNPWAIQQYLSSQGFETKTYTKRSTFDQVAKSADVCIMASFSLHAPGHIFMLDYEWGDYYRTIGPRAFLTMDQIMNLRFVSGSVILITVNKRT